MFASNGLRHIYCTERNHKHGSDKSHNQKEKTINKNNVQTPHTLICVISSERVSVIIFGYYQHSLY